jgi:predicted outer membrane repeat protein
MVRGCLATGEQNGGALLSAMNFVDVSLVNCSFEGNEAASGGAIYFGSSSFSQDTKLINCRLQGNRARGSGGAIWSRPAIEATGCLFSGNLAGGSGGAGSFPSRDQEFVNCTFAANRAGGVGGALVGTISLSNCVVWGNRDARESRRGESGSIFGGFEASHSVIENAFEPLSFPGGRYDPFFNSLPSPEDAPTTAGDFRARAAGLQGNGSEAELADDKFDLDDDGETEERLPLSLDGARVQDGALDVGVFEVPLAPG